MNIQIEIQTFDVIATLKNRELTSLVLNFSTPYSTATSITAASPIIILRLSQV